MRNGIILGIGSLILLLALAGSSQATPAFFTVSPPPECSHCHYSNLSLKPAGAFFNATHRFNGISNDLPESVASCTICHVQITAPSNFSLTSTGQSYNLTHRYNDTKLASTMFDSPGCANCHIDVTNANFTRLPGTPTSYLTSAVCQDCHKAKYDDWRGTNHANKLMPNTTAEADNLPVPTGYNWTNVSYIIIGISSIDYLNESGYFMTQNDSYDAKNKTFTTSSHAAGKYNCGRCHTTNYNASGGNQSGLPGIVGTWSEPGIACERCHGAGGNGHQVQNNASTATTVCTQCHGQANVKAWTTSKHAPPLQASTSCTQCHSPFNYANTSVTSVTSASAENVVCATCHNPHDVTLDGYRSLYSTGGFNANTMTTLADAEHMAKNSFFNSTASRAAGEDVYDNLSTINLIYNYDSSYPGPINVTGRPVSEVLCSECHYKHGIAHTAEVNLTHASSYGVSNKATCVDCHMATSQENHSFNVMDTINFPSNTCSRGTECHVTSSQNLSMSNDSVVPEVNEWNGSAHNDKQMSTGGTVGNHFFGTLNTTTGIFSSSRANYCLTCHSPFDWNPTRDFYSNGTVNSTTEPLTSDFKGITCATCHNFHDMGDWLDKTNGKAYGWYNKKAIVAETNATTGAVTRYKANYTMMPNTVELCGNCHTNKRYGNQGPGWNGSNGNPTAAHGYPAKDMFVGSWKQSSILNFECIDCHMYTNITNGTGYLLNDSQKIKGHSFLVNQTGLQNTTRCSGCHTATEAGGLIGTIPEVIASIQQNTSAKWNSTNTTVMAALANYKAYTGSKNVSANLIAQAYWNLKLVSSDESWGVHNPTEASQLLDDAVTLANEANASLGQSGNASSVQLKAGWNLVALTGTPTVTSSASVMSSVANSITVVWSYDTTTNTWKLYDPTMPSSLNTLTNMVPGEGYWIYSNADIVWTA